MDLNHKWSVGEDKRLGFGVLRVIVVVVLNALVQHLQALIVLLESRDEVV